MQTHPNEVLVDARNWDEVWPRLRDAIEHCAKMERGVIGIDIETHDEDKHEGLRNHTGKTVIFDHRRTTLCGASFWPEGHDTIYYLNCGHKDVANRLTLDQMRMVFRVIPAKMVKVCHNLQFELVMLMQTLGVWLENAVCSMQMAVSAYGADEYDPQRLLALPMDNFAPLMREARMVFNGFSLENQKHMTQQQVEVMLKFVGKASTAAHSYNGWVNQVAWGYGLKKMVKQWYGVEMTPFKKLLDTQGAAHMGELTGEQTLTYGCDDAYWCVRLYRTLLEFMMSRQPKVIRTFFEVENPMVYAYAEAWLHGVVIDPEAVKEHRMREIREGAALLQELRLLLRDKRFPNEPNERLKSRESWYASDDPSKGYTRMRQRISDWVNMPVAEDPLDELEYSRGAITYAHVGDHMRKRSDLLSVVYYQSVRTILHDLCGVRPIISKGKLESDQAARTRMLEREEDPVNRRVLKLFADLASCEQNIKLYLSPYLNMVDPETGRLYPQITADKNTRRTGMKNPNAQQLAKRNPKSQYIRGFYKPDRHDHVIISRDWSSIELVLIAEMSGDPKMVACYNRLPHDDQHSLTAADLAGFESLEDYLALKKLESYEGPINLADEKGNQLTPMEYVKWARTTLGKGGNFEYWYSGYLGQMQTKMGWSDEQTIQRVDRFRGLYQVAEMWRQSTIGFARAWGYVELPDAHRRYKFECTEVWQQQMFARLDAFAVNKDFIRLILRKVQTRANNQVVNAMIQGTCATLIKRSILRFKKAIRELFEAEGHTDPTVHCPDDIARFMFPIHDELVVSAHRNWAARVDQILYDVMCNHPDIFKQTIPDSSVSVGTNFAPYDWKRNPCGQIELDEDKYNHLTMDEVVNNLFETGRCFDDPAAESEGMRTPVQ